MNRTFLRRNLLCLLFLSTIANAIKAAPGNDDISSAIVLTSGMSPTPVTGNLYSGSAATGTTGMNTFCTITSTSGDVWYYFTAKTTFPTVSLTNIGNSGFTNLSKSNCIQIFNTNSSNSSIINTITTATLNSNSVDCNISTSGATTNSLTPGSALTIGDVYLIRISTNSTISSTTARWAFSIAVTDPLVISGRSNEVFLSTTLSGSGVLQYPWEITYGPDDQLWITESRGYKVYRMDPNTGTKTTVLDLNSASTDLSAWGADSLRAVNLTSQSNWNASANNWPQGGLAGLAIHPQFGDGSGHDFVYISYVHRYLSTASGSAGIFFRNKIVRFTYNSGTGKLGAPAVVCDTIPGGQDHNSQRMIIAPVTAGGTEYLFYAGGDMGAGQYANRMRPQNAQNIDSYEGKILRFNLEPDSDGDVTVPDAWIPDDNPYNTLLGKQSAVYSIGIRNNQGFAYDTLTNKLYGASHGPYSDDEINIIESFRNYGHPLIEGFVDGNYDGNSSQGTTTSFSAGAPYTDNSGVSTCPPIGNEATNKATIDASGNGLYKDPLFSAYAVSLGDISTPGTVAYIWKNNPGNAIPAPGWPTESWSGLDIYSNKLIPGWKRSLVAASLKWGRLVRLKLDAAGTATAPSNTVSDTVTYFNSQNRFRDLAFSPDGKDIFLVMDNNSTTSGPGSANPVVPSCAGCVIKYTFLGYADNGGKSSIPTSIDVTAGTANTCSSGTTVTIDANNNNLWVPITGPDGNIMAEINANGQNLGTITSSFYTNSGAIRVKNGNHYLDRNMTITPQTQPSSAVKIRLYFTKAEYDALDADALSGVNAITDVKILKNSDPCGSSVASNTTVVTPDYWEAHGANGYMLQASISGFSSFYFGNSNITLPIKLISFSGSLQKDNSVLLNWRTEYEVNTSYFTVERSTDGNNFSPIGTVAAAGNNNSLANYSYTDKDASSQASLTLYYRLKMVDIDGAYTYSKIVTVTLNNPADKITIRPNPTEGAINISIPSAVGGKAQWKIMDNTGRIILQNSIELRTGNNLLNLNVTKLSAGSYYLSVYGTGIDQRVQFQKL